MGYRYDIVVNRFCGDFVGSCTMHSDENEFEEEVGVEKMMICKGEEGSNLSGGRMFGASQWLRVLHYQT